MSEEVSGEFLYNYDKIRICKHKLKRKGSKLSDKQMYYRDHILSGFYSLIYIMNGNAIVYIDDKIYRIPQNSLVIADKFSFVLAYSEKENCTEDITIDFKSELFGRCPSEKKDFVETLKYVLGSFENEKIELPQGYCLKDSTGRLEYLFNNSLKEYQERKLSYIDILRDNIRAILIEIGRSLDCFNNSNIKDGIVQRIIDYAENHYAEKITVESLARSFSYSESYVTKTFKREMGMTFSEYLRQKRIYVACNLIRKENIKIEEIAHMVGFKDIAHFMKCFKKYVGMSPGQYRLNMRKANDWFIGLGDLKSQKDTRDS